mmetsp:Transcript_7637/g.9250  ORF Transcript_7637/g.9250 Transcript_7637/m.9250 type:complete len:265 (-) Transcript_7637:553-1347(-)
MSAQDLLENKFLSSFAAVCNGIRIPDSRDTWAKKCHARIDKKGFTLRNSSYDIQRDLIRLAQLLYFSDNETAKLWSRPISEFYGAARESWLEGGGIQRTRTISEPKPWQEDHKLLKNRAAHFCHGSKLRWYYYGIGKNGVSTFTGHLSREIGMEATDRYSVWCDWKNNRSVISFIITREPTSRFISAYLEISIAHSYLLKRMSTPLQQPSMNPNHFTHLFEQIVRAEPYCQHETSTVWCLKHVNSHIWGRSNPTWAWIHIAPQM